MCYLPIREKVNDNINEKLIISLEESDFIDDVIQLKNGLVKNKKIKEICPNTFNILKE